MDAGKLEKDTFIDISQFGLKTTQKSGDTVLYELDDQDGYGKMLVCRLFPGVDIYYNDYNTTYEFAGKFELDKYFELSYSQEGTYEFELKDNRCIYIGEGEFMAFHNIFESLRSRFPQRVFKGFGIIFDIKTVNDLLQDYFKELSIDLSRIIENLCTESNIFVIKGNPEIQAILEKIYFADPYRQLAYVKIKVLELLYLLNSGITAGMKYKCRYYEKSTVLKVKQAKDHLTEDLSRHITIEQLSKEHNITKTMLKTCFKDIFGLPPYEYLKKARMNQAAFLIKQGKYSISEVGGLVGYQNASKFSGAFKDVMGMTPSEYGKRF